MATATEEKRDYIVKVQVLRRWQGSPVNKDEICGVPLSMADALAGIPEASGGPAVRIISREPVKHTEGTGADPWFGTGGNQGSLYELVQTLLAELREERAARTKK